jgi:NAD(P)-dependent dehydrogenase (short-subunit alcohol dehydrogenase family)
MPLASRCVNGTAMSQKLRIVLCTAPGAPWAALAARLESGGAEVLLLDPGANAADLPPGWVPDGLVTTPAGHEGARFDRMDLDRWEAGLGWELGGRFRTAQAIVRAMRPDGDGSLVHLLSADGMLGAPQAASAAIAAFASAGLSRSIALDMAAARIRSNCIAVRADDESLDAAALLIRLLCGEQGRGITGQIAAIGPTQLHLLAQSRPQRIAHRDGGWDEASLTEQVGRWSAYLPRFADAAEALR